MHFSATYQRVIVTYQPDGKVRLDHLLINEEGEEGIFTEYFAHRGLFEDYKYELGLPTKGQEKKRRAGVRRGSSTVLATA